MIKVEHTKTHIVPIELTSTSQGLIVTRDRKSILVTDAQLVLIEPIQKDGWNDIKKLPKAVFISKKEKIEVGELFAHYWYDDEYSNERAQKRILISAADAHTNDVKHRKNYIGKILALPEHFSPKQLQDIVDGKLKDGDKVLVECETTKGILQYGTIDDYPKRIKLNPHITIYPVEERMYTRDEVIQFLKDFGLSIDKGDWDYFKGQEWFEQNVK